MSSNLANCKERRVATSILPLVDTNRLYQEANLAPPWTRTFAVAKDQVLNCLTRNFLARHETLPHVENFNDPYEDLTSM
jgi:hypothetical protein